MEFGRNLLDGIDEISFNQKSRGEEEPDWNTRIAELVNQFFERLQSKNTFVSSKQARNSLQTCICNQFID